MKLTVVGSGDAFGAGGRLQTCFHVEAGGEVFLVDCGVTALIGFYGLGLDPNRVSTIFVSHLHGDHFGGLVWWVLHARHIANRTAPLVVVGPKGIEDRYRLAAEALYPGSLDTAPGFDLSFREFREDGINVVGGVHASVVRACHPSGAPSYALRFEAGGKTLGFSGDSQWVDGLLDTAEGADLFICECFGFEDEVPYHLNWRTLKEKLPSLSAKRVLLTHMGEDMLAQVGRVHEPRVTLAEDGLVLEI